jgi:NodT family efflux transporter outer membrane factor (OMF) lipoprotein
MKPERLSLLFLLGLSACSLAPIYQRPLLNMPLTYKETGHWNQAMPTAANISRGQWWEVYDDGELNQLEQKVSLSNQDLRAALARYQEARAAALVARAGYYPTITGIATGQRLDTSGNIANRSTTPLYNDTLAGANLSYEIDLWGRIRNQVAAAENFAKASAADLAAMDLSLHAELASDYFALRGDDEQQRILDITVVAFQKSLHLTQMRLKGGASSESDVDQAQTQLEVAKTAATDMRLKRAQLEHAIAILIGVPPAEFSLRVRHQKIKVVSISSGMPSTLLERRPDIAAAELRVEAANANIGVARAAYFPDFSLQGMIGFESQILSNLIGAPSLFWAIGPQATLTLVDGGRINALLQRAKASYDETVANYRQIVLNALRDVEDNLVALHRLNSEVQTQAAAVKFSERALKQANYRYVGGLITYIEVVITQNTALQAELAEVDIRTRRQLASVQLIKALGGGWTVNEVL